MRTLYENLPEVEIGGRRLVGRVLFGLLVLISVLVGTTAGLLLVYTTDLPQVNALEAYRPSSITEIYDDHGRVIGSFALQRRVVAAYDDFPPFLRDALVSTEDKDFYSHTGINFFRIAGAAYRDIESAGKVQGASTLTMQLARNLFLSPDRRWQRKVQEAMLAIQIERRFTKPQIFTLYANHLAHDPNSPAPYFVEEIRRYLEGKYGTDQVHEGGLRVYTSLDVEMQKAANQAVLDGLAAYERRHGWKDHLENVIAEGLVPEKY